MDEDLYSRYLPIHTAQFTAFNIIVELYPANHLPVHYATLGRVSNPSSSSHHATLLHISLGQALKVMPLVFF
jgi:hypothetical protein